MILVLIAVFFGILNRCRGNDFYGLIPTRAWSFSIVACLYILVGLIYSDSVAIALTMAFGTLLWATFGWGKYFMSIHGKPLDGGSVGFVDKLTDRIVGKATYENAKLWGTVGMNLRGGILDAPMWIILAYLISPLALIGLLFSFCQGVVYYLSGRLLKQEEGPVGYAEIVFGGIRAFLMFVFI